MKKIVFLLLVLLSSTIYANILEVGNTGQAFTSIQLAIHTAVSGDTILIHPGRYYENLTVGSKTLTLSSLYLFSQDETDINNTIIDGNQQGQGLYMFNSHNSAVIGLTFEHGIGSLQGFGLRGGGAILARNSQNLILKANIVQYNRSFSSGGIALTDCSTFISGNVIRFNSANFVGGLSVAFVDTVDNGSAIVFDNVHKNSIYSNAGGLTNDLSLYNTTSVNALHLDIASYAFYSKYYIKVLNTAEENIGLSDFTAEQSFFQPVIQDLYVSINGDDSNSGLSMNEPLRNIYTALSRIQGNIESPVTIFIEPGVYSPLEGEELFPLLLKDGVHFKGYNGRFTIDCLNQSSVFDGRSIENVLIQDLNIDNPGTQFLENENIFYLDKGNHVTFKNISVSVSLDKILFIFNHMWIKDLVMQNIEVNAPRGSSHIFLGQLTTPSRQENILINGGKRAMSYGITSYEPETLPVSISNVGIFNVSDMSQVLWGFPYMGCAFLYNNYANEDTYPIQKNYFSNFTVSNCTGYYGPVHLSQKSKVNFYNSIFYNNQPNIIGVINEGLFSDTLKVNFKNCLFFEDSDSTFITHQNPIINRENCLYGDPGFIQNGDNPYALSPFSQCIDAGTLDFPPDYVLPETDLAGKPRVYNGSIDIGAYEYNPLQTSSPIAIDPVHDIRCSVYPNPVVLSTSRNLFCNFDVEFDKADDIDFSIYNIKGQKIITLAKGYRSKGQSRFNWDGKDEFKRKISSGIYLYKIKGKNSEVSGKFTVID